MIRALLLGSYPSWPYESRIRLRRDTRHINSWWNVHLANALAERPGTEIHFASFSSAVDRDYHLVEPSGLNLHFLRMDRWVKALDLALEYRLASRLVRRLVRDIGPDVVHGIGTEHPFAYAAVRSGLPNVVTVHGVMSRVAEMTGAGLLSRTRLQARLERLALGQASHMISISPYVIGALGQHAQTAEVHAVPNPIAPVFFAEGNAVEEGERSGLLFVGMIQPRKGLDVLLDALARLPASERPGPLRIIGPAIPAFRSYQAHLEQFCWDQGLGKSVEFVGHMSPEGIASELRRTRALVLPSREETAPMVISEAMACGAYVIATDVGGVRHMLQDAPCTVIPAEAPAKLAEALRALPPVEKAAAVAERAREEARAHYHPTQVASATEAVYRTAMEGARMQNWK